jgi:hypothetical protein
MGASAISLAYVIITNAISPSSVRMPGAFHPLGLGATEQNPQPDRLSARRWPPRQLMHETDGEVAPPLVPRTDASVAGGQMRK